MKRVLLSTTWGPFLEQYFNTSPTDVMNQRFSRGCSIFSMSGHLHVNFAHLIAQNIDQPSVFLEYPSRETFLAEIKKNYAYVAISSFHNQVDDLIQMCRAVREKAPESQIVLGGWGARGLQATLAAAELREICDHLCHGDGIRFFRTLLGEDPDREAFHSHLPKWSVSLPMINRRPGGAVPVVVGSLGCPNGCDFCGTTEMFSGNCLPMMTPQQVYREFRRAWEEDPDTPQATLIEEDSFANKEFMSELGRLLREDPEFGLSYYNFYCLATIKAMSQWSFEDLMLTGCANVFVGVESKFAKDGGYAKTCGLTTREMFEGLHNVGICTTGAWMAGFDFQTRSNIDEDLQEFVSLAPVWQQLTRVCPFPATPLWKQMKKQGRIRPDVTWEEISFYGGGGMPPKNFNDHEIMEIIERGYKQLYETHGASIARMFRVHLLGYAYCMENKGRNRYLEDRAVFHKRQAMSVYPLIKPMEVFAPNSIVRKKMKDLRRSYHRLMGEPPAFLASMEKVLLGVSGLTHLADLVYPQDNIMTEEPFTRYVYSKPAPAWPACPYEVSTPGRRVRQNLNRYVRSSVRRLVRGTELACALVDRARGLERDEATRRGTFLFFY